MNFGADCRDIQKDTIVLICHYRNGPNSLAFGEKVNTLDKPFKEALGWSMGVCSSCPIQCWTSMHGKTKCPHQNMPCENGLCVETHKSDGTEIRPAPTTTTTTTTTTPPTTTGPPPEGTWEEWRESYTLGFIKNETLVFLNFSAQGASILKISVSIIKRRS